MIRHIVLTKFRPETSEETIHGIYAGLSNLTNRLPGARGFTGGRSESPEQIERGYMHGFVVDFDSWEALQAYADNPEHKALGGQLVENAVGGIDGILVLDLPVRTD
ncbi:Dabb family protein [uncultured Roseobacter sp.]|uniref:Dabb family protein n=1 Tax=uncultured Roseobacter sp. TaxID=114847 RepID=UPI00260697EB|nr:Dabb family protein [uncultured Roseobacter sp.]